MITLLASALNGTGLNRGTTERSSSEFGSSLTDSCVNEKNGAITAGLQSESSAQKLDRVKTAIINWTNSVKDRFYTALDFPV